MMETTNEEIAAAAAQLVVEEGLEYGPAKRRALKQLGLPPRTRLPDNDAVENAVREHIALFHAETQPAELAALRRLALEWMERMAAFRPYLGGAVWRGTATRLTDVQIHLFCDDPKSAEIAFINQGVRYSAQSLDGPQGACPVLSVHGHSAVLGSMGDAADVGVHFFIHDHDELRGALRPDGRRGRSDDDAPLGSLAALRNQLGAVPAV